MKRWMLVLALALAGGRSHAQGSFAGTWDTTFGPMTLTQKGAAVEGHYEYDGNRCPIRGTVEKRRLPE